MIYRPDIVIIILIHELVKYNFKQIIRLKHFLLFPKDRAFFVEQFKHLTLIKNIKYSMKRYIITSITKHMLKECVIKTWSKAKMGGWGGWGTRVRVTLGKFTIQKKISKNP